MSVLRALACIAGVTAALAGCGSSASRSPSPVGTYVGTVASSDAFVAVVAGKATVVVYVCDGAHRISVLAQGPRTALPIALSDARGARVSVALGAQSAAGAFTPARGPRALPFTARVARGGAGFYRAVGRLRGARTTIGWVVLNDGRQRGAISMDAKIGAAPQLKRSTETATLTGAGTISAVRISPTLVSSTGFGGGFGFGG